MTSAPAPAPTPALLNRTAPLPVAEAGTSTSEWRLTLGTLVANAVGVAVAFGAPIDAKQQAAILAFVGSSTTLSGMYALARNLRKRGTTG